MLTRRRFVGYSAMASAVLASHPLLDSVFGQHPAGISSRRLRLAILGSKYTLGSDMQNLADHFLVGYPYDGEWHMPNVQVVSVYVDQRARRAEAAPSGYDRAMEGNALPRGGTPEQGAAGAHARGARRMALQQRTEEEALASGDLSVARSQRFGFRLSNNIPDALRCGGDRLAVDAVLTVLEQDGYQLNEKGQILLPSYDFFQQCTQVFEDEKRSVPYFNYRQLSFSFAEAKDMAGSASRLGFPLMSGSAMPVTWRLPSVDIPLGAEVKEAVMVGVGGFDGADFDALDAMQAMLERRKGGETGVRAVQLLEGDDVWAAGKAGRWSQDLLSSALSRSDTPMGLTVLDGRTQDLVASGVLPQLVKNPAAYCIEYNDGTRATLLMLNGAIRDFNISVRIAGRDSFVSNQFFLPPPPNKTYTACLAAKIEKMFKADVAPYPVERTLLTTGILEASMNSRHRLNQLLETPYLSLKYRPPAESQYVRS